MRLPVSDTSRLVDDQRGAVLVLTCLVLIVLIAVGGLVIDLGRLQVILRQMQSAADSASLAGVTQLENPADITGWRNVKKATLAAISRTKIHELDPVAKQALAQQTARYTSGGATFHDCPDYQNMESEFGNFEVRTQRGVFCYDPNLSGGFIRRWFTLEDKPNYFCLANSVEVTLTVRELEASFAKVMVGDRLLPVSITATAHLNVPNTCGQDLCSSLGIDSNGVFTGPECGAPPPAPVIGVCP